MSAITIEHETLLLVKGVMCQLRCGVVINRPTYIKEITGNEGYAVVLTNFESTKQELSGSVTWGDSGFGFEIFYDGNNDILYQIKPHAGNPIADVKCGEILEKVVRWSKVKILNKLKRIESDDRQQGWVGMMLKASKKNGKESARSIENLEFFKSNQAIDPDFSHFVRLRLAEGISVTRWGK